MDGKYTDYVEHPHYGRAPIFSDLKPEILPGEKFVLMNKCWSGEQVDGTAVVADMERQKGAAYFVKYYFDEDKTCTDCKRRFIFFAQEQKYLYEKLGFNINGAGRRCFDCRKVKRAAKLNNLRYAELAAQSARTASETVEMADICLHEIEAGRFHPRQQETVRMLINQLEREFLSTHPHLANEIAGIEGRLQRLG